MQQQEIGDGINFLIVFTGELLNKAGELLYMGLHPNEIISGFSLALQKANEFLEQIVLGEVDKAGFNDVKVLQSIVRTAIMSKQNGNEDLLAGLVAKACHTVMPKNPFNFSVDNVRIVKVLGSSMHKSEVVRGMVVNRPPTGQVRKVKDAKIAIFTESIDAAQTDTKGTVLLESAADLLSYNEGEEKHMEKMIKSLADSGVRVVASGSTIGEMAQHFLDKNGILSVKIPSKFELRRLARASGAKMLVNIKGAVHPDDQGFFSNVYTREVGDQRVIVFEQDEKDSTQIATIMLRAPTYNILNDLERACNHGVNTCRMLGRDGRYLAGAGASEIELARRIGEFGEKRKGLEQYAVKAFGEAFEVVPRTLAENTGLDEMEIVSKLYAAHEKGNINVGVDILGETIGDATSEELGNIRDLLAVKANAIKLATDVAITVLRVDHIMMSKPAGGPRMDARRGGHWDDD
eukprot:TRINITY_DN59351_c0_g1_i2.p2 TRINITY_DN59351_c0_g1~~TRINITY_DN59351_c0_g1_i2.p2  ORF type:complete len:462 (+),score=317.83 TRINITY_DN59351_c0_g1_i2:512-1897(+)